MLRFALFFSLIFLFSGSTRLFHAPAHAQDADKPRLQRYEFSKPLMGVKFRIVVYSPDRKQAEVGLLAAMERIAKLEDCFSDYDPDSEISRLAKRTIVGEGMQVSSDLMRVLLFSDEIHQRSGGSFDPTIAPLSKLWRVARKKKKVPDDKAIESARSRVGWSKLELDKKAQAVKFCKRGMQLDFGGIAKGFAADEAIRILRKHKLPSCLVDAGGDITLGDAPPGKEGWSVAISEKNGQRLHLANASIATSGDRFQFLEHDGKRYSHIIDPKTGWGVTNRRLVTVITKGKNSGAKADAWASALSVMPFKDVATKVKNLGLAGVQIEFVGKSDDPKFRENLLTHGLLAK